MKIIITEACGHIGSYVTDKINQIKKIKEVILIDNLNSQRYSSLFNLKKNIKFSFYNMDLSRESLNKFKKINLIIHGASLTNAEGSFSVKKEMFRNNLKCMKNVIDFCKKNKSKLIHISSTSVYGSQVPYVDEDCKELKPQSPYADVKLLEEESLKKKNIKFKYVSLRFGTIVGPSTGMRFHTAVNKFCMQAYLNHPLNVWKTALNQFRPYLSIRDSFKALSFFLIKKMLIIIYIILYLKI